MSKNNNFIYPRVPGPSADPIEADNDTFAALTDSAVDDVTEGDSLIWNSFTQAWIPNPTLKGGTALQILAKRTDLSNDFEWVELSGQGQYSAVGSTCLNLAYQKDSATQFTMLGKDYTGLFVAARRLLIADVAGATYRGTIVSGDVVGNDTVVVMLMDSGVDIPDVSDQLCLVGDSTSWAIPTNPTGLGGGSFLKIGEYGGNQQIMAVGPGNAIATSIDGGITWVTSTAGAGNITGMYFASNNRWYFTGFREIGYSTDGGLTWTIGAWTLYYNYATQPELYDISEWSGWLVVADSYNDELAYTINYDLIANWSRVSPTNSNWAKKLFKRAYDGKLTWTCDRTQATYGYIYGLGYQASDILSGVRTNTGYTGQLKGMIDMGGGGMLLYWADGSLSRRNDMVFPGSVFDTVTSPFVGTAINGAAHNPGTNVTVIVGDGGKIGYSTDFGVTWDLAANNFGLTNIADVIYLPYTSEFLALGADGSTAKSSTGYT